MKNQLLIAFGAKIRKLRTQKKLSQEELADIVNLHRTYIGNIERGEKNLTLLNIEKFANVFSISIPELLNFNDED